MALLWLLLAIQLLSVCTATTYQLSYVGPSGSDDVGDSGLQHRAAAGGPPVCGWPNVCSGACINYLTGGLVCDFKVYTDAGCTKLLDHGSLAITCPIGPCPGTMMRAGPASWPSTVYFMPGGGFDHGGELAITLTQDWRLGTPGALLTLGRNSSCVPLQGANTGLGIAYFPCGSGGALKAGMKGQRTAARARPRDMGTRESTTNTTTCTAFTADPRTEWVFNAYMPAYRVSSIVDCRKSAQPCPIPLEKLTTSWHVSFQAPVIVAITGFSGARLVGDDYDDLVTYTTQPGVAYGSAVPPGQNGFLSAYTTAAKAPGTFKLCEDGKEYRGSVLVPQNHGVRTSLVITNAAADASLSASSAARTATPRWILAAVVVSLASALAS